MSGVNADNDNIVQLGGTSSLLEPPAKRARVAVPLSTATPPQVYGMPLLERQLAAAQLAQRAVQVQAAILAGGPQPASQPITAPPHHVPSGREPPAPPVQPCFEATAIDADRMQGLLQQQAAATGQSLPELWRAGQRMLLELTLLQLKQQLEVMGPPPKELSKLTAGMWRRTVGRRASLPTSAMELLPSDLPTVCLLPTAFRRELRCGEREPADGHRRPAAAAPPGDPPSGPAGGQQPQSGFTASVLRDAGKL